MLYVRAQTQLKELLLLMHTITMDNCELSCVLAETCYLCFVQAGHGYSATVVLLIGR